MHNANHNQAPFLKILLGQRGESFPPPPPGTKYMITEDGKYMITEDGKYMITEN